MTDQTQQTMRHSASLIVALAIGCCVHEASPAFGQDTCVATGIATVSSTIDLHASPPANVRNNELENNTLIVAFNEKFGVILGQDVLYQCGDPGRYDANNPGMWWTLFAGTRVNSHLLHFDTRNGSGRFAEGTLTFASDVIGVILVGDHMIATDSPLGAPGTLYPTSNRRAWELNHGAYIDVSADRRTLTVGVYAAQFLDQARVLTAMAPYGTGCWSDGNQCTSDICDGVGNCVHPAVGDGTPCGDTNAYTCDDPDSCLGGSCRPNYAPNSRVCRGPLSACMDYTYCTGFTGGCPSAPYRPAGYPCRPQSNICDAPEYCTGNSYECPADVYRPFGYSCRPPNGACDWPEHCTGDSPACPADGFKSSGYPCRSPAGPCDAAELCTGDSPACPGDVYKPAGQMCRSAAGPCDASEHCSGVDTACPPDQFQPGTFVCRGSSGECDPAELCEGNSADCPGDAYEADGTLCSDDANQCTADVCETGACTHPFETAGAPCGDQAATECDSSDTCDGAGACLANFIAEGAACGDSSTSECDSADICDGAGACDPNHQADGLPCSDDGNACTGDVCGAGLCAHASSPAGTACGDASDTPCDNPDSCDGAGACLDNVEAAGFACGDPSSSQCDNADICDGAGGCQPDYEPLGAACSDGDACTEPDTCDGSGSCIGECDDPDNDEVCTPCDNCHLANPDQVDCDGSDVGDLCEIVEFGRPLAEDRFDIEGAIVTCTTDADCLVSLNPDSQVYCVRPPDDPGGVGVCYVQKNRYISIDPNLLTTCTATARRVALDLDDDGVFDSGVDAVLGWVGEPMELAITGSEPAPQLSARVVAEAARHYRDWSLHHNGEPWVEPSVHLGDCSISPGHTYFVQAIAEGYDISDEALYSVPVVLKTVALFGDVTGGVAGTPPDNIRNFKDISAVVRGFQSVQTEPKVWLDLQGGVAAPEVPDFSDINFADINWAVKGFQGGSYPFAAPCDCPGQACP